jgi:hypothetical protein
MSNLGAAYADGRGVVQDDVQAHKWLDLATSRPSDENREQAIRTRDGIAARMTIEQITEAQRLARARDAEVALRERTEREAEARLKDRRALAEAEAELEERRRLAEQGDVIEQFFLGLMLRVGREFPKDEVEAAHWLRRAADQGMASAHYVLGLLLTSHSTTEPLHTSPIPPERLERMSIREQLQIEDELEHAEALRWFRSAADGGYPDALSALAYAYFYGEPGVPQDYVQAYVWGSIAANNLNPGSERDVSTELRDNATSRLTVDERAEGDRLVQEWSEAHETRYNLPGMPPPPPPR